MTNNVKTVLTGIRSLSNEDTKIVIAALNARIKELRDAKATTFSVGQRVSFESRKAGGTVYGLVQKVNKATIVVKTDLGMTWRVTPTLLKAA
jgi:exosome complex RNA-binding protein Csl4